MCCNQRMHGVYICTCCAPIDTDAGPQLVPKCATCPSGRPRHRRSLGDHGYDHDKYRGLVRGLGVKPLIARRGTEHGSGLAAQR